MKGTALTLLCALALTQASQSQRNSDGTKTCNCNPGEAQTICSDYASDGIQIAHEHCNKFYQCFDGRPIPFTCPSNLMYNAELEICDWPQNVVCGDRPIIEEGSTGEDEDCDEDQDDGQPEDKDSDNNGSDGNNQVDGEDCEDEDNSDATCNCNPSEAPNICKNKDSDGVLVAHENCNQFYKCFDGAPVTINCPLNLMFNPRLEICDWPERVDCGDRVIPDSTGGSDNGGSDNGGSDIENVGSGNCDPSEAPAICASEGSNGVLVAHENCNQFYKCSYGKPVALICPGNLLFNPKTDQCDWPENIECDDRIIPDGTDNGDSDNGSSDNGGTDNGGSDNGGSDNETGGAGNCDPSEAPSICASEGSNGVLVAHENCNQFYKCSYGKPVALICPGNLLFNPSTDQCDWPENIECGDRIIPDGTDNGDSDNGSSDNGGTDNGGSDNGGSDNETGGTGNCDPSEAPSICASEGSNGVLVAHENCNQFYKCSYGKPVALICPGNLLFNPSTDQCDWPENIECGDRIIPDGTQDSENGGSNNGSGDNGGTDTGGSDNGGTDNGGTENGGSDNGGSDNETGGAGNCDPSEAPSICASEGSNGVLVAHENCNQFYICSYGKPVAMRCPGNLLFNPSTDQCDWPEKVECGDRIVPDGTDNGDSDNGGSDNGGTDNEGSDNGGSDNGGNGNVGACNCNPSEAPSICAAESSDGVLVAHENCNQFYKCFNGKPVALNCPGTLLFNPHTEQCDWSENVDCGERLVPDETDNGGTDNGGNDNGGSDNGGSDNGGSDNGGTDNGGSDNSGSDNGGNGNVGACNCNPSEAPSICAAEGSDGVLVAHENCNQFYKCSNGKPVALNCPGTLLFNPHTEQCDWPENVDCGERLIPDETDNGGTDNGGNDNGGSDNGGTDNGGNGNVGAGNCDPSEAPSICASEGSDGVLVAHENCNQFYKCSNGKPVSLNCPGTLLFNPNKDQCDWAENVDCGERVIPDETDNGGSDNGGSDNGGTDNGGSDNGGTDNGGSGNVGAGNCDPSEAPSICAADGSDGVLVAHEKCNQFYTCSNGKPVALKCPGNLLFNPGTDQCDWPENVDCGERVIPDETDNGGNDNGGSDNGGSDNGGSDNGGTDNGGSDNGGGDDGGNGNVGAGNCDPSEAPSICAAESSDGVLVAHENCNQFYTCSNGKPVALKCPGNLLFNPSTDQCDWPENVDCGERVIPDETDNGGNDNEGSDNGGNDNGGSDNGGTDNGGSDNGGGDNGGNGNVGAGNCDPSEAPSICAAESSDGVLVAHENCNQFYMCSNGKPITLKCPGNLLFNPSTDQCDWPENVDCGERVIPDETDNGGNDNGGSDNGGNDNGSSDNGGADNGGNDNGGSDNGGNGNVGACNCNPSEAPSICAAGGSDGVLVAHENCNQFYKCSNGKPVALNCPGTLLFNPHTEQCDWPENVDCGERVIPDETDNGGNDNGGSDNGGNDNGGSDNGGADNGGSDNGGSDNGGSDNGGSDNGGNGNVGACNCNPSEAPSICAAEGSDGVLVAHENCNQFYKCSNGKPVALNCPGTLLFNPHTEQCDWPENVDCGERLIPDETDNGGNDNGGNDNGGSDNGGTDNEGSENGGSDNGGNGNVGACNCNPSEAPSICAAEGSDGVLVAHENCNQFYKCSNGKPVALNCPGTLLFNPHTEQCDWPENVDCSERLIPDETDNGGTENGGNDNGSSDNGGSDNGGSDNGGSDNGGSDNGGSDNGGSDNGGNGNVDSCNCNPSEAPSICAAEGSDGVLIAHENCNQFYKCSNGKPVALNCPGTLLFNPHTEQCDWPENVDCGERLIPDETDNGGTENGGNDNGGSDNGGSDNGGSDNGGSDNGDSASGGNNDPSEAAAICGSAGSNGVLVAHEKCNKFYMCADGSPVPILCASNLLFNPSLGVCDWPRNVDCGDRIIPDSEDVCLCNARQAPSICSGERSNGLLIAHEYCNQYYVCVNGSPVARSCPLNHLYNPHEAACDWAQNVSCEEREVSYSLNKHVDARQTIRF